MQTNSNYGSKGGSPSPKKRNNNSVNRITPLKAQGLAAPNLPNRQYKYGSSLPNFKQSMQIETKDFEMPKPSMTKDYFNKDLQHGRAKKKGSSITKHSLGMRSPPKPKVEDLIGDIILP